MGPTNYCLKKKRLCHAWPFFTVHCRSLQLAATHCDSMPQRQGFVTLGLSPRYTATHCNSLHLTATHCNSLQLTVTQLTATQTWICHTFCFSEIHCNTLQHTATHCNNTVTDEYHFAFLHSTMQLTATQCNSLQLTATHCNSRQYRQGSATLFLSPQYTASDCSTLQHTATHCNTLQLTATHCNTDKDLSHFPFLHNLAEREDLVRNGKLTSIIFLRDKNSKGQEVSGCVVCCKCYTIYICDIYILYICDIYVYITYLFIWKEIIPACHIHWVHNGKMTSIIFPRDQNSKGQRRCLGA